MKNALPLEERIARILATVAVDNTLPPSPPPLPVCETCGGRGVVGIKAEVGSPNFGKIITCPNKTCPEGNTIRLAKYDRLMTKSGLPDTYKALTLAGFAELSADQRKGKELAAGAAWMFSQTAADNHYFSLQEAAAVVTEDRQIINRYSSERKNWLVLQGGLGLGKTGLAAAVVNELSLSLTPVLFFRLQELFQEIQGRYGKTEGASADDLILEIQRATVLILDEFNISNKSADKTRIVEEIIRYRHGRSLPTIITCNLDMKGIADAWGDRTADVIGERAHWLVMGGQKLRRIGQEVPSF
jgi:DNA replication protein DnaC